MVVILYGPLLGWCVFLEASRRLLGWLFSLPGGLGGVFAQRGHSANHYGVHPGNTPANHPPTEACMIHSKQHRGCGIEDPGTHGYRGGGGGTADCSHSAGTVWAQRTVRPPVLLGTTEICVPRAGKKSTVRILIIHPNSMSNVLTQYLTLVGTLRHNTFSDSTARSRMGSEKQKGGGVGQQAVGQAQHPSRNCGISAKGGRGKKKFCDFFLRNPFLRRAQSQKLTFFLRFSFAGKQDLGPEINYFRK